MDTVHSHQKVLPLSDCSGAGFPSRPVGLLHWPPDKCVGWPPPQLTRRKVPTKRACPLSSRREERRLAQPAPPCTRYGGIRSRKDVLGLGTFPVARLRSPFS